MNELTRAVCLMCALMQDLVGDSSAPGTKSIMRELRALSVTLLERSRSAAGYADRPRGEAALERADQVEQELVADSLTTKAEREEANGITSSSSGGVEPLTPAEN